MYILGNVMGCYESQDVIGIFPTARIRLFALRGGYYPPYRNSLKGTCTVTINYSELLRNLRTEAQQITAAINAIEPLQKAQQDNKKSSGRSASNPPPPVSKPVRIASKSSPTHKHLQAAVEEYVASHQSKRGKK